MTDRFSWRGFWPLAVICLSTCQHYQTPPLLSAITPEQLSQSPIVVVGRVAAIRWGPAWAEGHRTLRAASISISNVVSLSGQAPTDLSLSCYIYQSPYAPPFEGQAYNHMAVNQYRIFFLQKRDSRYFGVRDGDALSLRAASVYRWSDFKKGDRSVDSIVKVLMSPAREPIDSGLPDRVSEVSAKIVVPLVGRAQGLRMLESLLESNSSSLRARACESILYFTGLPHRCLDYLEPSQEPFGIPADAPLQHCIRVNAARFDANREVAKARLTLSKECESSEGIQLASWIDHRKDCDAFVDLAVSHLARKDWHRY